MLVKRRAQALAVFRAVTREVPSHRQAWRSDPRFERALQAVPNLERTRRGLEHSLAALKS